MSGEPRACRPEELPDLVRLANQVFRPRGGNMEAEYPLVFRPENCDNLRVIDVDGRLVSHVGLSIRDAFIGGIALRVASVGAVCTADDQRGQGFASALMADAATYSRAQGAQLMLISGGRGLYHRLGYVTVGEFRRVVVPQESSGASSGPDGFTVTPFQPSDLDAVMAIHQGERVRFVRPAADWKVLLHAGMLMNHVAELLVVRQAGEPVAYLGVQQPARDREGRLRPARASEIGGSRWAIAESLGAVADHMSAAEVEVITHASDREWQTIARARGWRLDPTAFTGTLGILDPPALFSRLAPLIAERLGEQAAFSVQAADTGALFELGAEQYEVGAPGPLAALLFGGETEEARAIPPRTGELGKALSRLFPLPLLWYGYNYV
jgi:GNAT superfamily N-acetyltransferase